jgi:tripeptide aminopeptidase
MPDLVDRQAAVELLMRLLAVEGTTGKERAIGAEIERVLDELGLPASARRYDGAETRIPLPTESGNLIVTVDGDPSLPSRLFVAHRDTVPLCAGAKPLLQGDKIVPAGATALGGDNRTGVAVLLAMIAALRAHRLRHGPLVLVFTVREESGLWGARHLDAALVGKPALAFNVDGSAPEILTIGATGASRFEVEIVGKAAHAGLHPEAGISAPMVAATAMASLQRRGWFGKVQRPEGSGTTNIGTLSGRDGGRVGGGTNVVVDYVRLEGEARSHDERFAARIVEAYRRAFGAAGRKLENAEGAAARVDFKSEVAYHPFRLPEGAPAVTLARQRVEALGRTPELRVSNGGLDANWLVRHGLPALTFGAGQRGIHTLDEHAIVDDYVAGCELAVSLALP